MPQAEPSTATPPPPSAPEFGKPEFSKAREQLASDLRSLAAHTEQLLQATAAVSGESVQQLRRRSQAALETAASRVREHPLQALAGAALAGALVGAVCGARVARRRRRRDA